MLKKIIKGLGLSIIILILVTNIVQINQLKQNTVIGMNYLQDQVDSLYGICNNLINLNELLIINLIKNKQDLENSIKEIQDNLKDVDVQHILRGDVIVVGIEGMGSGTVIKKTDTSMYILTCYHVIADIVEMNEKGLDLAPTVGYLRLDEHNKIQGMIMYGGKIVKYDKNIDLALLKINIIDNELQEIKIADKEPQKGDIVYSVGNPLGFIRTISKGILANKIEGFYLGDNTISYGNSGGGLYNKNGELIGIPSNVTGYSAGIDKNGEETFIPESSLGMSIDLLTIKNFLEGVNF